MRETMPFSPDDIEDPSDLNRIPEDQLQEFADACRTRLVESVSESGGHFGASLGVTELTVALHYLFNSPEDKLIWDVGHQGYIHKMLTGRNDDLETIRTKDGLAPFLKREESEHDIFNAGHASTSISAAVGIAEAFEQQGRDNEVIPIIGDGAMTAGMAYEALNNAGWLESDIIVVLNDNGMSIARNVGAITEYFNRLIHLPAYRNFKDEIKRVLGSIPRLGESALDLAESVERSLKNLVFPKIMFEELDFNYFGPVDGHDMDRLLNQFRQVKKHDGPRFVHVLTEKGHGYEPAEQDEKYAGHSTSPFVIETGETKESEKSDLPKWSGWASQTLTDLAVHREELHSITAAMRKGTQTVRFKEEHPERFHDVGIAEQHSVTFAAGLATQGEAPVVSIYSTFLQRAFDQVVHDVCLMDLPVRFIIDRASIVGGDGDTHQGIHDMVYLRSLPNIVLGAPKNEYMMQHYVKTIADYDEGPIGIRIPRLYVESDDPLHLEDLETIPIGKGVREREGSDVALIAIGTMVPVALKAARELQSRGISAEVINARWVKPLDRDLIAESVSKTDAFVTVEEGRTNGGFGSAVLELLADEGILRPGKNLGIPRGIVNHGDRSIYLEEFGLTPGGITETAVNVLTNREESPSR
jgi:1-deoxy-D-xylulose-5-phosphate synthase